MPVIGFILAAFFILAGSLVVAGVLIERHRRERRRRELMECFRHALDGGMIRGLSYVRERKFVGDGWLDIYRGSAGTMRFSFSVTIEPWVRSKSYRLHLAGEDFVALADPEISAGEFLVRVDAVLRGLRAEEERRPLPGAS